jgi:hypothetical protein
LLPLESWSGGHVLARRPTISKVSSIPRKTPTAVYRTFSTASPDACRPEHEEIVAVAREQRATLEPAETEASACGEQQRSSNASIMSASNRTMSLGMVVGSISAVTPPVPVVGR